MVRSGKNHENANGKKKKKLSNEKLLISDEQSGFRHEISSEEGMEHSRVNMEERTKAELSWV